MGIRRAGYLSVGKTPQLDPSFWLVLVAVVVAAGFGTTAAVGHITPTSPAVSGLIGEEPVA